MGPYLLSSDRVGTQERAQRGAVVGAEVGEEARLDGEMAEMRAHLAAGRREVQRLAAQAAKACRTLAAYGAHPLPAPPALAALCLSAAGLAAESNWQWPTWHEPFLDP